MPIPTPRKGESPESKNEFVSRCMSDSVMKKDYTENKQRVAICLSQWERKKKASAYVIATAHDEFIYPKESDKK